MNLDREEGSYLRILMPEEIDHHQTMGIRQSADKKILEEGVRDVVFDFRKTKLMDSAGIGLILGRYRTISVFGGNVYVVNANERICGILKAAGLDKMIKILATEKEEER
ncbi:MAG: anti-sigma factor antagonist [Lachnospiraceae bacterium]|nr:anti-sigma factor antagonist [Lachnospiraceae bacterium]